MKNIAVIVRNHVVHHRFKYGVATGFIAGAVVACKLNVDPVELVTETPIIDTIAAS